MTAEGIPKAREFRPKTLPVERKTAFEVRHLCVFYGATQALFDVSVKIARNQVTAIIGPSGCGKSTFLRTLNRMHENVVGGRHTGTILLGEDDLYSPDINPAITRRRVGMVFQKSNPFPMMSIRENVLAGLTLNGQKDRAVLEERLQASLTEAGLWEEVKDRLQRPGMSLSGGQQQRLCIARALAIQPEILLMDEPCSALDPLATAKIEELIHTLRDSHTVVIVTHNMQQAARCSDQTAFFYLGRLIEYGDTREIFTRPSDPQTEAYVSGRFG